MSEGPGRELLDRLASLPPGPELCAVMAAMPAASSLSSSELALVAQARLRQIAHEQARLLVLARELALSPWQPDESVCARMVEFDEFSADQVAVTLTWSRFAAQGFMYLARDLICRLPMVFDALLVGRLDLARARVFSDGLAHLDDETARRVALKLLAKAPTWTVGNLRKRLRYQATKADPRRTLPHRRQHRRRRFGIRRRCGRRRRRGRGWRR